MVAEGWLSIICEEFNCTPEVAESQNISKVLRIIEYRMALRAKAMMGPGQDITQMEKQPHMVAFWKELNDSGR